MKIFIYFLFGFSITCFSQELVEVDKWDNQLFLGNKVAWGKDKWRYSGELQVRLKDNMKGLSEWFIEECLNIAKSMQLDAINTYMLHVTD